MLKDNFLFEYWKHLIKHLTQTHIRFPPTFRGVRHLFLKERLSLLVERKYQQYVNLKK